VTIQACPKNNFGQNDEELWSNYFELNHLAFILLSFSATLE
jgi:hypothetical protein